MIGIFFNSTKIELKNNVNFKNWYKMSERLFQIFKILAFFDEILKGQ